MKENDTLFDSRRRYGVSEAAKLWGCSRQHIYDLAKAFPYLKAANRTLARMQLRGDALNRIYYGY